ncbi:MAG: cell division protein FtsL [Selenomonadaceae bacterium]
MLAKRIEESYGTYEEIPVSKTTAKSAGRRQMKLNTHLRSRCMILLMVLSAMAIFVTVRSGVSASRGYELVQIKQETARLEKENEHLKLDIAQMKSPQRIKQIAVQNLGMVLPKNVYFAAGQKK